MVTQERKQHILKILSKKESSAAEILEGLSIKEINITKITLNRDLASIEKENLINRTGSGKATKYKISNKYKLLKSIDFADYFSVDSEDRNVQEEFNFEIFPDLTNLISQNEQDELESINQEYQKNVKESSPALLRKELERLVIELSWKSSKLEGNTYTLLETEQLIQEKTESEGHSHEEALMILNHKTALDYVIENRESFQKITIEQILKIHELLTRELGIAKGFRKKKVGIIGTKYKPLKDEAKIKKATEALANVINKEESPLAKALIAVAMISYIQAFEDGNKRTARILSTAILLAHNYCPLSYRKVDDYDYKKAMLLFYEQNNIRYFKQLFIEQFKFSVEEYF